MALRSKEEHVLKYKNLCGLNAIAWTIFKDQRARRRLPMLSDGHLSTKEAKKRFDFRSELNYKVEMYDHVPSFLKGLRAAMMSSLSSVYSIFHHEEESHLSVMNSYKWILEDPLVINSLATVVEHGKSNTTYWVADNKVIPWEALTSGAGSAPGFVLNLYYLQKCLPPGIIDAREMLFRLSKVDLKKQPELNPMSIIQREVKRTIDLNKFLEYIPDTNKVELVESELRRLGYGMVIGCIASMRTPPEYMEWFEQNRGKFSEGITMPKVMLYEYIDYMFKALDREFKAYEQYRGELIAFSLDDYPLFRDFGEIKSRDGEEGVEVKCPFH